MRDLSESGVWTIINPGSGYASEPASLWPARPADADIDREWPNTDCPRLKTVWRPQAGSGWVQPVGWQGGYVNLDSYDGAQIWTYDEFWTWVKETSAQRWDR